MLLALVPVSFFPLDRAVLHACEREKVRWRILGETLNGLGRTLVGCVFLFFLFHLGKLEKKIESLQVLIVF